MATEYKVVRMAELFAWPTSWRSDIFEPEFAQAFGEALTRMAAGGWEYAGNYIHHQHVGAGYAIFRREAGGQVHVTGEIVRLEKAP